MNIHTECKTRAILGFMLLQNRAQRRMAALVVCTLFILLSGTVVYGQEYMRSDGTTGSSKVALSEALPGEYDNVGMPDPQYPPGIMPEKA